MIGRSTPNSCEWNFHAQARAAISSAQCAENTPAQPHALSFRPTACGAESVPRKRRSHPVRMPASMSAGSRLCRLNHWRPNGAMSQANGALGDEVAGLSKEEVLNLLDGDDLNGESARGHEAGAGQGGA